MDIFFYLSIIGILMSKVITHLIGCCRIFSPPGTWLAPVSVASVAVLSGIPTLPLIHNARKRIIAISLPHNWEFGWQILVRHLRLIIPLFWTYFTLCLPIRNHYTWYFIPMLKLFILITIPIKHDKLWPSILLLVSSSNTTCDKLFLKRVLRHV